MNQFNQRKKDVLSKQDKSSKGDWDERIIPLCDKLNSMENYYSTSSCSGRIIVMKDDEKKGHGLFEFVSHDLVRFDEFWEKISPPPSPKSAALPAHPDGEKLKGNLKFKQTAVILHIACKDLENAKIILEKGLKTGFKKSGIISLGKNIIVELNLSEKMEFPLVEKGKLLVSEEFLKKVIEKANSNLEKGWKKIDLLFEEI